MQINSILIVEDEVLIAKQIKNWLLKIRHSNIDICIDYSQAIANLNSKKYDLVFLDVQLSDKKTGIDVALWIRENISVPFIFLTSYSDEETLNQINDLNPIGFINKPIKEVDLYMMTKLHLNKQIEVSIKYVTKKKTYSFDLDKIVYVQSDHVYLKIGFADNTTQHIRCALSNFLELVPNNAIIQINRGVAINPYFVTEKSSKSVKLHQHLFSISNTFKGSLDDF